MSVLDGLLLDFFYVRDKKILSLCYSFLLYGIKLNPNGYAILEMRKLEY